MRQPVVSAPNAGEYAQLILLHGAMVLSPPACTVSAEILRAIAHDDSAWPRSVLAILPARIGRHLSQETTSLLHKCMAFSLVLYELAGKEPARHHHGYCRLASRTCCTGVDSAPARMTKPERRTGSRRTATLLRTRRQNIHRIYEGTSLGRVDTAFPGPVQGTRFGASGGPVGRRGAKHGVAGSACK